jgi:hypothetical protein
LNFFSCYDEDSMEKALVTRLVAHVTLGIPKNDVFPEPDDDKGAGVESLVEHDSGAAQGGDEKPAQRMQKVLHRKFEILVYARGT